MLVPADMPARVAISNADYGQLIAAVLLVGHASKPVCAGTPPPWIKNTAVIRKVPPTSLCSTTSPRPVPQRAPLSTPAGGPWPSPATPAASVAWLLRASGPVPFHDRVGRDTAPGMD